MGIDGELACLMAGIVIGFFISDIWNEKDFEKRIEELRKNKSKKIMDLKIKNDILKQVIRKKGYTPPPFWDK